jgi:ABC-type transporter Mla subunit MlaD
MVRRISFVKTWRVEQDGSYTRLDVSDDLTTDAEALIDDLAEPLRDLRRIFSEARRVAAESRALLAQVRRQRRRRSTRLHLIRSPRT